MVRGSICDGVIGRRGWFHTRLRYGLGRPDIYSWASGFVDGVLAGEPVGRVGRQPGGRW